MKSHVATALFSHRRAVSLWSSGLLMACALAHPVKSPVTPDMAAPTLVPATLKPDDSARAFVSWSVVGLRPVAQA